MLLAFEARSRRGDLLVFPLEDDSSGFRVAEIQGLGPVKATLVSSSFAGEDGELYQSSRREARNIKIKLELDPDPQNDEVWDLRKRLYRIFMTEARVKLTFVLIDGRRLDIEGVVEDYDSELFTADPEVQLSIMCFKPDFIDPDPVIVPGSTTSGETGLLIDYEGTVETGIQLVLNVDRTLPEFTIYHTPLEDSIRTLEFNNYPLVAGDTLTISTVPGAKGATLLRSGVTSSVLYGISPQSNWIQLEQGENDIRVYAEGAPIPFEIQYMVKFGGL